MSAAKVSIHPEVAAAARTACRIGFPVALALAGMAALGFLLGIATPPRSGPWCVGDCTLYPFADAMRFFPRDYLWMAPGILLTPLFLIVVACIYMCVPPRTKPWALIAGFFAAIATALVTLDYFVQVLVVQPSMDHHEMDGVALLTQYNPRGLFIAMEDLGYLLLTAAFAFLAAALPTGIRPAKAIRWTLGIAALLVAVAFGGLGAWFGVEMGLPFELAVITVDWIGLVVAGILMAVWFRRAEKTPV
jgi:hypothetical protein